LTITAPTVETWTGGNGNNWSTNPNWVSTYAPGYTADSLIFTGNNNTPVMDTNYSVAAVTFNSLASSFTLTNNGSTKLTLTSGLTNNSVNAQNLNLPVALGAPVTVNAVAGSIALNGVVSGVNSLTLAGAVNSTLTLSGSNTFTGGVNLNGGVVALNAPETLLASGPLGQVGSISFGGGTMQFSGVNSNDYSARFSTAAGNIYKIDTASRIVTFATALTSTNGSLTLSDSVGGGSLTLNKATSTFTGNVNVNGGTLIVTAIAANTPTTTALGAQSSARTVFVNSGGTLDLNINNVFGNTPTSNVPRVVINGGTLNISQFNSFGTSSNSTAGLILTNGGVLNTTGASGSPYFAGNFGDLVVVGGNAGSSISGGQTLDLWSGNSTGASQTGGATTFNVASTGSGPDLTVSTPLADCGWSGTAVKAGLIKAGNGVMELTAANTYTGNTLVNAGTLAIGSGGSISSTNITIISGAIFDTTAAGGYALNAGQTLVAGHTNTPTATDINGGLSVGGILDIAGSGTAGTLTVSNGDLTFASSGILKLDLSNTVGGANDQVVVHGNLDGAGTTISIRCPAGLQAADYVLLSASGTIGNFNPAPVWVGTAPTGNYAVKTVGSTVVLHYQTPGTAPTATSASATPSNLQLNDLTTFSITAVPGAGASAISSITVNLGSIGGSPSQVLVDTGNHLTFTNSINIPANDTLFGPVSLPVTLVDNNSGVGSTNISLSIYVPPTVTATAVPNNYVYSGQNVQLHGVVGGTAVQLQWQVSPDFGSTWNNIPGATTNDLIVNPLIVGSLTYQLVATNAVGTSTSDPFGVTFNALPTTPPGLWTASFQFTNNVLKGAVSSAGIGHYVGRGILGTNFYWNVMPALVANLTTTLAITSLSDLLDDGVTHSGIYCYISNSIPNSSDSPQLTSFSTDIRNLMDQYQTYTNLSAPLPMVFKGVPDGTYNLAVYAVIGQWSDRGTTIVVNDSKNGNQTNSTLNVAPQTALVQGNNFVVFSNVHVSGGTLVLNLSPNLGASNVAVPELDVNGAQLQLVSYDTPAKTVTLGQTYSGTGNSMTLTWAQGNLLTATNILGPWTTNFAPSPLTVQTTNAAGFFRVWAPLHP
jgi:autotransporter-associated beta strand protein